MTDQGSIQEEAIAVAAAVHQVCVEVDKFVRDIVVPQIPREPEDPASAVLCGQLFRVSCWLRTIAKLYEAADFQAIAAGARALFETAIDMVLVNANPGDAARMAAWEESARFKHAEAIERHYESQAIPPRIDHEPAFRFAKTARAEIDALRLKHGWKNKSGKPRHPPRWTGNQLDEDAKRADRYGHRFKFSRFYETEYGYVCWLVHGAAFVHRRVSSASFPGLGAQLYPNCAELGVLCAELAVRRAVGWTPAHETAFSELRTRTRSIF